MKLVKSCSGIVVTLVCAVLISGLLNLRAAPRGGAAPTTSQNGDVNCDGRLSISDPIALLNHLFQGGPAPCAVAQDATNCCPEIAQKLDRLIELAERPCDNPDARLELSRIGTDSVTVDHCTGLMWMSQPLAVDLDLDGDSDTVFTRFQLDEVVSAFAYAGFSDWRVPTAQEIQSLIRIVASVPYELGSGFVPGFHRLPLNQGGEAATLRTSTPAPDTGGTSVIVALLGSKSHFEARNAAERTGALLVRRVK